jgi:stearoyl-CoA desaturase (Delta-9 desaturase)
MTTPLGSRPTGRAVTYLPPPGRQLTERLITLMLVLVAPAIGVVAAVVLLGRAPRLLELGLFFALYVITTGGVTAGYHRLFTHKSYTARRPLVIGLAVAGGLACQGSLFAWVADHIRHHRFSDVDGDPHSPYFGWVGGVWRRIRGLLHAHFGWFFVPARTDQNYYLKNHGLTRDGTLRIISRLFPLWVAVSLVLPAMVGWLVSGTWDAAFGAFLWGGPVRLFAVHHTTWSVNSLCHTFGSRPYRTGDRSTNNGLLALPSLGEGWHNNHHSFPWSARHGLEWWQVDLTYYFIRIQSWLRLAYDVRVPTAEQMAKAKAKARNQGSASSMPVAF